MYFAVLTMVGLYIYKLVLRFHCHHHVGIISLLAYDALEFMGGNQTSTGPEIPVHSNL